MTKSQLVKSVQEKAQVTKSVAEEVVDAVLDVVKQSLVDGEDVALKGFGTFNVSKRAARKGRNPLTGEEIEIGEKNILKFKFSSELKKAVNS